METRNGVMTQLNLVVIRSIDMERSAQFYRPLGLTFTKHRHGNGPEHYACEASDCVFEIYPRRSDKDSTMGIRLGFRVTDMDGLINELAKAGVKIVTEPRILNGAGGRLWKTLMGIAWNLLRKKWNLLCRNREAEAWSQCCRV